MRITALMFVTMVTAALLINGIFSPLGLIPTGPRPPRADIFSAVHLDYKLALNLLGVAIFAALFWLTARRGATDPVCGMKVDRDKAVTKDFAGETARLRSRPRRVPARESTRRSRPRRPCAPLSRTRNGVAMTERGRRLYTTADGQIAELIGLITTLDDATLRLPCPGREKLGDGTIAACAWHTADNYQRIAAFVQTSDQMSGAHATQPSNHRIPRFVRALGHGPADHTEHGPGAAQHDDQYTAGNIDLDALVKKLTLSRDTLARVAVLTDSQLDAIPPKDSFRFCDGQRTLEQVLASVLKHQSHQLDALQAATPSQPGAD